MSDDHGPDHDDAAEAHDDHGFDGEPAKELGPEEPATPLWLSGVGAALFALGAIVFLTRGGGETTRGEAPSAPEKRPVMVQTVAAPRQPAPVVPPGASGSVAPRKLSAEQMVDLQRRIKEAQEKKKQADGAK